MAKENKVIIIGEVIDTPEYSESDYPMTKYRIKYLKKNGKPSTPTVRCYGRQAKYDAKLEKGTYVLIDGSVLTRQDSREIECPECKEKSTYDFNVTEIQSYKTIPLAITDKNLLEEELLNQVILLGSLCRPVDIRILPGSTVYSSRYQMAVNRKFQRGTDYPWINSFQRQAEEDIKRMDTGSQCMINGKIQTRKITRDITCLHCQHEFEMEDLTTEVVATAVEYLNNCKF